MRTVFNAFPDSTYSFDKLDFELPDFFIEWMFEQQEKSFWYFIRCSHKIPPKYLERLMDDDDCTTFAHLICRMGIPFDDDVAGNYYIPLDLDQKIWERHRYFEKTCHNKNEFDRCIGECESIISSM